jgi:hypothetical protein
MKFWKLVRKLDVAAMAITVPITGGEQDEDGPDLAADLKGAQRGDRGSSLKPSGEPHRCHNAAHRCPAL